MPEVNPQDLIGKRIEIPVHYDLWMRGARFGEIVALRRSKTPGTSDYLLVKMDNSQLKRQVKLGKPELHPGRVSQS